MGLFSVGPWAQCCCRPRLVEQGVGILWRHAELEQCRVLGCWERDGRQWKRRAWWRARGVSMRPPAGPALGLTFAELLQPKIRSNSPVMATKIGVLLRRARAMRRKAGVG